MSTYTDCSEWLRIGPKLHGFGSSTTFRFYFSLVAFLSAHEALDVLGALVRLTHTLPRPITIPNQQKISSQYNYF